MEIINWIIDNPETIIKWYLVVVGVASVIVKATPTLSDDHVLKGIIRIIGKYIALNRK